LVPPSNEASGASKLSAVQRFKRIAGVVAGAVLVAVASTACSAQGHDGGPGIIQVPAAYVQVPASAGGTTVGYLDIRNNGIADALISVSTSVGGHVQLRGPERAGVTPIVMHTVASIPLAADATTQLVPNSYHLLISGEGPMYDGKDITLTLKFAHGGAITILALVTNPQNGGSSYFLN
jgi:periplasmic copper chaperone A